ncbi:MAG: UDP-3-O-(3-hydroxymyristoyl)glucosamine N-acyltransferase, partial [Thiomonas sp. 20-64-5]
MDGLTLEHIVARLGGELVGNPQTLVERLRPIGSAGGADITFLSRPKLRAQIAQSQAAAIILPAALKGELPPSGNAIFAQDPYLYYALLSQWFWRLRQPAFQPGRHALAHIDPAASVSGLARVDAFAVI